MENGVPTHFHKVDRISETDLIPNGKLLSDIPVSGQDGERIVVFDGSTYAFYQYLNGAWQQYDGATASGVGVDTATVGQYASEEYDNGNKTGTATIDWNNGNVQYVTLTGNTTLTFSNPLSGGRYLLHVAGAFSPTFPASVRWPSGVTPTPTASAGNKDIYSFVYSAKESLYDGLQSTNFSIT
jgi:hypothetical protein